MKNKGKILSATGITMVSLFFIVFSLLSTQADAKPKVVAIEGISYNVNASFADNLKSLVGKKVYIALVSGKTFSGVVKKIGNHLVHLEKLDGKEYFDALIRLENISAIDTRFRDYQR
ncbi:MAG: hypothetical protein GY699_13005 [Desulfobacteraceae bacterium]|nr:hypothetical protein [Desulfobacteraceae bacterium]